MERCRRYHVEEVVASAWNAPAISEGDCLLVPHVLSDGRVNGVLADVLGVIADPLEVTRYKDDIQVSFYVFRGFAISSVIS